MKTVLELITVAFDATVDPKSELFTSIMSEVILTHYELLSGQDKELLAVELEDWSSFLDVEAVQALLK